jgi:hypothetical protein
MCIKILTLALALSIRNKQPRLKINMFVSLAEELSEVRKKEYSGTKKLQS